MINYLYEDLLILALLCRADILESFSASAIVVKYFSNNSLARCF